MCILKFGELLANIAEFREGMYATQVAAFTESDAAERLRAELDQLVCGASKSYSHTGVLRYQRPRGRGPGGTIWNYWSGRWMQRERMRMPLVKFYNSAANLNPGGTEPQLVTAYKAVNDVAEEMDVVGAFAIHNKLRWAIKRYLVDNRMNQSQAARESNVNQSIISQWLRQRRNVSFDIDAVSDKIRGWFSAKAPEIDVSAVDENFEEARAIAEADAADAAADAADAAAEAAAEALAAGVDHMEADEATAAAESGADGMDVVQSDPPKPGAAPPARRKLGRPSKRASVPPPPPPTALPTFAPLVRPGEPPLSFVETLRRYVAAHGVDKAELARRMGTTPQSVGQWLSGHSNARNQERLLRTLATHQDSQAMDIIQAADNIRDNPCAAKEAHRGARPVPNANTTWSRIPDSVKAVGEKPKAGTYDRYDLAAYSPPVSALWTQADDEYLLEIVRNKTNKDTWQDIADLLGGGRTRDSCRHRWNAIGRPFEGFLQVIESAHSCIFFVASPTAACNWLREATPPQHHMINFYRYKFEEPNLIDFYGKAEAKDQELNSLNDENMGELKPEQVNTAHFDDARHLHGILSSASDSSGIVGVLSDRRGRGEEEGPA